MIKGVIHRLKEFITRKKSIIILAGCIWSVPYVFVSGYKDYQGSLITCSLSDPFGIITIVRKDTVGVLKMVNVDTCRIYYGSMINRVKREVGVRFPDEFPDRKILLKMPYEIVVQHNGTDVARIHRFPCECIRKMELGQNEFSAKIKVGKNDRTYISVPLSKFYVKEK